MKVFNICLSTLLIAIFGAVLCLTRMGLYLEEEIGLSLLFKLRGPLPAPDKVVIVSIDKASAQILHLPDDPEKWPRAYYAQLINKLNQQNPAIIAFNLHFGETRDSQNDAMLASAMAERRNIILSNYLKQYSIPSVDRQQLFRYERIIDPIPILDQAALGTAPFPLPKTSSTVKEFWAYKNSAGDIPTFPSTVFQCYVFKQVYAEIMPLLLKVKPALDTYLPTSFNRLTGEFNVLEVLQRIKAELANDSESLQQLEKLIIAGGFTSEKTRLIQSWLALLKERDSLYLNHYGNTETITTIPFYQAMVMDILNPDLFRDKIVLVGYSETIEPEKNQGLYTVFSNSSGGNISPIEIAATAVANLIDKSWIKPLVLKYQFLLVLGWGLLLIASCRLFSYKISLSLMAVFSSAYLSLAYYEFSTYYLWMPLCIPLMIQTPVVLIFSSILRFQQSKQENRNIHKAFSFYLPDDVVNQVTAKTGGGLMHDFGELMHGVCMATDAGQYTTLSETMNPLELNVLMNRYYGIMFPQVTQHHGIISDVIGDAMLALWAKPVADIQTRINACRAALEIKAAIDCFNQSQQHQLPTRLGLHYGEMRLGNVGAVDHFEYRAIGDTINTANRIEGLNKVLGTHILVSANVIEGLSGFSTREMGVFIMKGKTLPITIFELLEPNTPEWPQLLSSFTNALKLFQSYQWHKALNLFIEIAKNFPADGPTRFYIGYLQQHLPFFGQNSNPEHAAIIEIGNITSLLH